MQSRKESKRIQMEMQNFILHKNLLIIMAILKGVLRHILKNRGRNNFSNLYTIESRKKWNTCKCEIWLGICARWNLL